MSFSKMLKNKIALLNPKRIYLNGRTKRFREQTQKLEPPHKTRYAAGSLSVNVEWIFFPGPTFLRSTGT